MREKRIRIREETEKIRRFQDEYATRLGELQGECASCKKRSFNKEHFESERARDEISSRYQVEGADGAVRVEDRTYFFIRNSHSHLFNKVEIQTTYMYT